MWTRAQLKEQAKGVLRKYYWMALLVTFVAGILGGNGGGGGGSGGGGTLSSRINNFTDGNYGSGFHWSGLNGLEQNIGNWLPGFILVSSAVALAALIAVAIGVSFSLFVSGPVEVGKNKYFLEARQDRSEFVNLFSMFKQGRYINVVKAQGWRLLFTFLWTLLFIIPGIIKGYSYRMIPYLMADNPQLDYKRAMNLSMDMTNGEKWEMFVLDLSFLGWWLLGALACCVGVIFVTPYFEATIAELYVSLKQKALDKGLCSPDELGMAMSAN